MFYIYSSYATGDHMNQYTWEDMVEIFNEDGAEKLRDGVSIEANLGFHVNAAHAAMREANDMLMAA